MMKYSNSNLKYVNDCGENISTVNVPVKLLELIVEKLDRWPWSKWAKKKQLPNAEIHNKYIEMLSELIIAIFLKVQ